jgi:hypothetical protein
MNKQRAGWIRGRATAQDLAQLPEALRAVAQRGATEAAKRFNALLAPMFDVDSDERAHLERTEAAFLARWSHAGL